MEPTYLVVALLALVVGGALSVGIARLLRKSTSALDELSAWRDERERVMTELQTERQSSQQRAEEVGRLSGRQTEIERALEERSRQCDSLGQQVATLQRRLEDELTASRLATAALADREKALHDLRTLNSQKEADLQQLTERFNRLTADHANATANLVHAQRATEDIKQFINDAQMKLSAAFGEVAGKTFEERAQVFQRNLQAAHIQARTDVETLLKPFAERLAEFRQRVDTLYGDEAKERSALLGAVTELKTLNQDMASQAAALTKALKGSAKVRGDWGELMLENVLRASGLEEGKHYVRQQSTADDSGARLQPDVVVRLPDGRSVVVDSKVNLIAWQEAMNAGTPDAYHDALRRHAVALRQHMRDLAEKNYPKAIGDSALEITIAFVPIEGALSAALDNDSALQVEAFERKITFASPNTLMALLRVVERLWTRDKVQRQASEISDAGGKLLDALTRFLSDFDLVGKRVNEAAQAFEDARRSLSESQQAVIPRARRLAALGPRGRRALPQELIADETDSVQIDAPPD